MPKPAPLTVLPAAPASALVLPSNPAELEARIFHLQKVERALECNLAFARLMQGGCLAELRKLVQRPGTRTDLTSPNNLERLSWPDYVKSAFGFSDETARARIAMWDAAKPRLAKLAEEARAGLAAIFDRPISTLSEGEYQTVQKLTHKLTDGKTVRMIQEELGLFKGDAAKPNGGKRDKKNNDESTKLTPEAEAAETCEALIRSLDGFFAENFHTLLAKDQRTQFAAILGEARRKTEAVK